MLDVGCSTFIFEYIFSKIKNQSINSNNNKHNHNNNNNNKSNV